MDRSSQNYTSIYTTCAIVGSILLAGCGPEQVEIHGKTMGTYYSVKYVRHPGMRSPIALKGIIDRNLEQINDQMSTYRSHSVLSRFNQSREVNKPFPVSAATAKVVKEAIRINRMTHGALDITVGPLVNLWGFGPEGRAAQVPSAAELEKRRAWAGIDKLTVVENALIKHIPELSIDLSAIAKGYGVDVVAEYLESQQINDYMVDIGGEVRTRGSNGENEPWRIAIEKPAVGIEQNVQAIIQPGSLCLATSGDYRNYFEENGVRYSHTIDPVTGRPISHRLVSITVLSASCMTADGFATGLSVLGPEKAIVLANLLDMPVMMMIKTDQGFEARHSSALNPYLR